MAGWTLGKKVLATALGMGATGGAGKQTILRLEELSDDKLFGF